MRQPLLSQAIELSEDVVLSQAISVIEAPTLIRERSYIGFGAQFELKF